MLYRNMRKTARQLLTEIAQEVEHLEANGKRLQLQQDEIESRIEDLKEVAAGLTKILEGEPAEQGTLAGISPIIPPRKKGTPLGQFLRTTLADGTPKTLDEIADIAEKTIPSQTKGKSVRRMVNFALFALRRHGAVEQIDGGWKIRQRH